MIFKCPRCGYNTTIKANFKKHITNKILCNPSIADISLDDIRDEYFNKRNNYKHECDGCKKNMFLKILSGII